MNEFEHSDVPFLEFVFGIRQSIYLAATIQLYL